MLCLSYSFGCATIQLRKAIKIQAKVFKLFDYDACQEGNQWRVKALQKLHISTDEKF